jgi:heme-degrading monooxygenase HmoA
MHARITTINGATDIDGGIAFLRDEVVAQLQQQKGYRGLTASGDRASGLVSVLTLWETEADLDASESTADKARAKSLTVLGGQPTVERFEQIVSEVGDTPPGPGSRLQVRRIKMAPELVEENLAFFRSTVLPEIKATPGFQAVRQLINRRTGEGAVGTVWRDEAALRAAESSSEQRRSAAADRGVEFGEVSVRELLFSALL